MNVDNLYEIFFFINNFKQLKKYYFKKYFWYRYVIYINLQNIIFINDFEIKFNILRSFLVLNKFSTL